ncbi:MAG: ABC transporter permease subunit [Acidimicrobiales bacterium]
MAPDASGASTQPVEQRATTAAIRFRLGWIRWLTMSLGGLAVASLAAVVAFLVIGVRSGPLDWWTLLTSRVWDAPRSDFGAGAMIWGTAVVAVLSMGLAAPLGWGAALALHELAPARWRRWLRSGCELLAVVPSIVFGLLGVAFIRPLVSGAFGVPGGDSLLAAGLVLALMVLPTVVAVSVDALAGVPARVRESAAACGLNRSEVVRSAVLPLARRGMGAAVLLGLARALGETIAVFLVVGRADGRFPTSLIDGFERLIRPGQTLTTKLNGPESVLAGTAGAHWAAMCALGLLLLGAVAVLTVVGRRWGGTASQGSAASRGGTGDPASPPDQGGFSRRLAGFGPGRPRPLGGRVKPNCRPRLPARGHDRYFTGAHRARRGRDLLARLGLSACLVITLTSLSGVLVTVAMRGSAAWDPRFWLSPSSGAFGGGVLNQLSGTILLVLAAGALAGPIGLGLGLTMAELARPRAARWLQTVTLTLGGVPSILLGLWGYWLLSTRLGWGKSWLAGAIVLAVVAVAPVAVAVASAAAALPPERREAALALGLRREQVMLRVVLPRAVPGLVTGLLLGLARAAGETAPLLFTATVFSGAALLPTGVRQAPVSSLPTHIFDLAQDAADPAALATAWGAALALVLVAGALALAAIPARRRMEANAA